MILVYVHQEQRLPNGWHKAERQIQDDIEILLRDRYPLLRVTVTRDSEPPTPIRV